MKKNRKFFLNMSIFYFTNEIEKGKRGINIAFEVEQNLNPNFDFRAISIYDRQSEFKERGMQTQRKF
jgi:hypothetical protein